MSLKYFFTFWFWDDVVGSWRGKNCNIPYKNIAIFIKIITEGRFQTGTKLSYARYNSYLKLPSKMLELSS